MEGEVEVSEMATPLNMTIFLIAPTGSPSLFLVPILT